MSNKYDKAIVEQHKNNAVLQVKDLIEFYINSPEPKHLKKANLLSYWIEEFCSYVKNEESYSPLKQIRYSRGDVIKVNFGFNVGKEYGGLHYAIVLDKENKQSMHTVTVVPLTSGDEDDTHINDVYLGTELSTILKVKISKLKDSLRKQLTETKMILNALDQSIIYSSVYKKIENNIETLERDIKRIAKEEKELNKMKCGSIALINQITTIDKSRIYTPRKSADLLYHVRFSTPKMEQINEAIKKQFIF